MFQSRESGADEHKARSKVTQTELAALRIQLDEIVRDRQEVNRFLLQQSLNINLLIIKV